MQLAELRRLQFGQSSEKQRRGIVQLEPAIEEIAASDATASPTAPEPLPVSLQTYVRAGQERQLFFRRLPDELTFEEVPFSVLRRLAASRSSG